MSRIVDQGNETRTDGQMGELISPPSSVGPAYTLAGEAWLSSATLSRDGFDLVLSLDGVIHRVGDYFSFQTPPNLVLETGPSLTPAMVKSLLPRAFASDYLYAGPAAGTGLGEPIGTVSLLAGTATVRRADGSTEALSRGDPIYRGDVLLTGDGSFVKIRFTDGTTFQLGKNGEAALDDFEFNEAASIGNFEASIRVGGFYYKSGKIGEVTEGSADAHTKLSTPSSIISVRGSELEGTVDSSGQTSVVHRSGILVVTDQNGNNAVTLDQPGATAVVAQGGAPAFYAQAPAAVIQQIQASVQPQTGDEDVAPEESADEAQEEQTEEEASEEEAAEESEEEAEEEVAEEAVEEESEEEETEEDAEEDSEEEAQEESEEEASDSEEADEDAAEESEEATEESEEATEEEGAEDSGNEEASEDESEAETEAESEEEAAEEEVTEESSDEGASEDESEAETQVESEEEAAEEEVAEEPEAEADDEAAQEEEAAEGSAEDEASDESTEESVEEADAPETSEDGADEAGDEPAEEASEAESTEADAEEVVEEASDDASVEDASDSSAEESADEAQEASAEESGEEAAADSADESADDASSQAAGDDAVEDAADSSSEEGSEAQNEGDAASDGASSDEPSDTAADDSSAESASEDAAEAEDVGVGEASTPGDSVESSEAEGNTEEADSAESAESAESVPSDQTSDGAENDSLAESSSDDVAETDNVVVTDSADSGEAAASSADSGEGEAATSDAASPEGTAEAIDMSGSSSESSSDASQGSSEGPIDSGSSETTGSETGSDSGAGDPSTSAEAGTSADGADAISSAPTSSDASTSSNSASSEGAQDTSASVNTGQTQVSTETPSSSEETSIQPTSSATGPSQGTSEVSSTEEPVQPVLEQTPEEPPPDNPPEAQPDQVTVVSSEAITLDELVLANDVDVDEGQSPELIAVTAPNSIGDVGVTEQGIVFTPNAGVLASLGAGETLTETLEYTVTSGELSASSTIEITLEGANDAPVAEDDAAATPENESITLDVTANDSDVDGDDLVVTSVDASALEGEVSISEDGTSLVYVPPNIGSTETVTEVISYTVSDGTESAAATVTIEVSGVDDPITINPDETAFVLDLTAFDDPSVTEIEIPLDVIFAGSGLGSELTVLELDTSQTQGSVRIGSVLYTPGDAFLFLAEGETTTEQFGITVQDQFGEEASGTFVFTVTGINDPPTVTEPTAISLLEGSGAEGTVVTTVAGSDVDGDTVTYAITSGNELGYFAIDAGTGEVTLTADGAMALNNDALTATSTTIGVTVSDGTLSSSEAPLEITFDAQNDAPTVTEPTAVSLLEGSGAEGTVVTTVAGSDIDGDTVTYAITSGNELGYFAIDEGTGEVTLTADGATALNNDALTSTSTTIGVTVSDGTLSSSEAPLEIKFDAQNDAPTVTEPTPISLLEGSGAGGTVVTTVAGSDIDGDPVTYAITSGNELGYFAIDEGSGEVTLTGDGATALNDDALTSTSTTIGVTVSDGTLSSSEAPLEIKFDAQNDAPTTGDDTATVIAGGLVTITAGDGVLANDADVDSAISVESVVLTTPNSAASPITTAGQSVIGQYGTLTLEADGSFAYSADQTVSLQLLGGEQAVETFSVTVSDGELTDVSTLTITVDGVDDATVFFGDTAFTIDQDVSSQIFPVQGVLSSFDVDQHAVIAPVDAGQGTYGVFGFQPSNDVDGVDGSDPVEPPPNGSVFELPLQVIRPDTPVIDQQTGTVTIGLNYEVDDPSVSAPGLVLQIHYDSSVIQNPVLTSNAPGLIQIDDVEDIDNLDFDDATDRMILVAWASYESESLDWPGTLSGPIASLSFGSDFSQAQNAWTNIRFTGVAADGFILDAQSIQIYGDSGLPQQAYGTLSAGTWGYTPDPDLYRSLADGETVTDEYTFTSSDGQLHPVSVTLVGVNDAPYYQGVYSLPMDSIGTYVFSDQDVMAFDPDDGPTDIVYTVVDAQGGSVFVGGLVVTSFTQDDINNGRVSFVLDSPSFSVSTVTPLLTLSVEDGNEDGSEPELLLLNFTDLNASGLQFVEDPIVRINVDQVATVAVLTLLSNDLSSDGSAVTVSSVDTLSEFGGTVSFDGTDITYTPPSGFAGIDRVFYAITDSSGETSMASLTFEITQAPPSEKGVGVAGEEVIVGDMALPEDQDQPSDAPRLPESEDLSGALAIEIAQPPEAVVSPLALPNGALLADGDNLLFSDAVAESVELIANTEGEAVGEFVSDPAYWLADNLVESERFDEAFAQEGQLRTSTTEVTDQQWPDTEALNLAVIDELVLEGSHPFLSGNALVFPPESTHETEKISRPDELAAPVNASDIGTIPLLADLLTDGDEWMAAAFAGPSEVSTIQVSVPVTQSAEEYDAAILQYQKAVLDVDILAIETAHIVIT